MHLGDASTRVAYFDSTVSPSQRGADGSVLAQESIASLARAAHRSGAPTTPLRLEDLVAAPEEVAGRLRDVDVLHCNSGPLTILAFLLRSRCDGRFAIMREIHTTAWIGCHYQEAVARVLASERDRVVYPSVQALRTWEALRPTSDPQVFQPVIDEGPASSKRARHQPAANGPASLGYFSRVARDKGIGTIPEMVRGLREAGHTIDRVRVVGSIRHPDALERAVEDLTLMRCAVDVLGPRSLGETRQLMEGTDVVAFPSTSSYESAGRVVIEAIALGRPVLAGDLWAASDLLGPTRALPVGSAGVVQTDGLTPVRLGTIACDAAHIARSLAGQRSDMPEGIGRYRSSVRGYARLTDGSSGWKVRGPILPPAVARDAAWMSSDPDGIVATAERYAHIVAESGLGRADLRDLDGVLESAIGDAGFRTEITVELRT